MDLSRAVVIDRQQPVKAGHPRLSAGHSPIGPADGFVTFQVTDIVAAAGHQHRMDRRTGTEPGDEASGSIGPATLGKGEGHLGSIGFGIYIERRAAPV